jgi:pimeloyl-ACP methyl ester carboxylesterase
LRGLTMEQNFSAVTVILVHGLWMTGVELRWLGRQLERCGFTVRYFRYCSWHGSFDSAAAGLRRFAERQGGSRVHLLGHSLGGLVIARMLEQGELSNLGRIVLLGSPQQGSALASSLERCRAGRFILGPVALQGIVHNRPAGLGGRELLVIAGTLSIGVGRFFGVAVPNDGTVAAVETEVPGTRQVLVRASHMGMLFSSVAADSVCKFLHQ